MSGNSTLDPNNLLDCLIPCVDDIRRDVHTDMGTRAYRMFFVRRQWSGKDVGEGTPTDTEVEVDPRPLIHPFASMEYQQEPCGLDEAGFLKVTQVSLCYNHEDVLACEAPRGTEFLIRLDEGNGQGSPSKYFVHEKPPYEDRHKTVGWIMYLVHVETVECPP